MKCILLYFSLLTGLCTWSQNTEVVIQSGHYDQINGLAFSSNGKYLVSVGKDNKAILWDLRTKKEIRTLRGHTRGIVSVIFSPDDKKIITGGDRNDMSIHVYNTKTGEELYSIKKALGNSIESLVTSDDGKYLVAGTSYEYRIWELETGKELVRVKDDRNWEPEQRLNHTIESIDISKDNSRLILACKGRIQIRDFLTGEFILGVYPHDHGGMAHRVRFNSKNDKFYTAGSDGDIVIWDTKTGKMLDHFPHTGGGTPCPCLFNDGLTAFYNSCGSDPVKFDLKSKSALYKLQDKMYQINSMSVDPKDKLLAIGGSDKNDNFSIQLYNAEDGHFLGVLEGFPGAIRSLDFSSDGKSLLSGSNRQYTRAWDLSSSAGYINYSEGTHSRGDIYSSVRYGPKDDEIFYATQHTTFVWNVHSQQLIHRLSSGNKQSDNIEIAPDGKHVITTPGRILIYNTLNGEKQFNLQPPHLMLRSIALSDDGQYLYAAGHKEVKKYKLPDYIEETPIKIKEYAWRMDVSKSGKELATVEFSEVYIRNSTTGEILKKLDDRCDLVRYSADGKYIFTANEKDYSITMWDASNYEKIKVLDGHHARVNSFSFTPDGRIMASGSEDTSIILWDIETGKEIAKLIAIDKENYIVITPDNYYMTSKDGTNGVVFRRGNKIFPFEQFDLHYNRPDIVLERLGFAEKNVIESYRNAYKKRIKKLGFNEEDFNLDFEVPELEIRNKDKLAFATKKNKLKLDIAAKDEKYTIDRLNVWINDVPIYGTKGIDLSAASKNEISELLEFELAAGHNKIQVSVHNKNGVESLKETFYITFEAGDIKPNLFILAIGDSEFKDKQYNLKYAAKDVDDFAKLMSGAELYSNVEVKSLLNKEVTRANIKATKSFLEKAGRSDRVIVFIAGHGVLDANFDYYLATYDMDFDNPKEAGIAYEDIEDLLDGIASISKLLIMDTCHSGEVDKDEVVESTELAMNDEDLVFRSVGKGIKNKDGHLGLQSASSLVKEIFTDMRRGTGATVISSAGGAEFAMESDQWKNGLFTYCMLNGLTSKDADLDDDGQVMLSELQKFVKDEVSKRSNGRQIPTSRIENVAVDYRLW